MSDNENAPLPPAPDPGAEAVDASTGPEGGHASGEAASDSVAAPVAVPAGAPVSDGDPAEGSLADAGATTDEAPRTAVSGRPDFAARLDAFQGPLDLLLYLIKESEVEISHIPIARVLEQYLKFLDEAQSLDLHLAGEFLVMAATLMEIKSRELLPVQEVLEGEELIEDPRSELVRQLLRYRQLKDRARGLEARLDVWQQRRSRGLLDEIPEAAPEDVGPPPMPEIDLYELLTIFERVRKAVLAQVPREVGYEGETLEDKVTRIERTLKERPFARFSELVSDLASRPDIALTFIALLELVRRRMIRLMQEGAFGNLQVRVQTQEEAEALARSEAASADDVVDSAFREKAERQAKLEAEAEAMGVAVDQLPWKKRRALLAKPKFEGIVRPEDVEELDAEEAEISRRIDAILAAADAITQRFEQSRAGQVIPEDGVLPAEQPPQGEAEGEAEGKASADVPGGTPGGEAPPQAEAADADEERPLTEEDLAPRPERPPASEEEPT